MRIALIFGMAVLVVTTHQYFHDQPMMQTPWLSPYSPHPFINKYQQPFNVYYPRFHPTTIYSSNVADLNPGSISTDFSDVHHIDDSQYVFPDTQSRMKGVNLGRLSNLKEQSNARYLYNLLSSSGIYTNPFFKTATFTITTSLSLTTFVTCVPSNQVTNGAAATACRRKRSVKDIVTPDDGIPEDYPINPSETFKVMPTSLLPSHQSFSQLSSSKDDDVIFSQESTATAEHKLRDKRFWFLNKNQFVVSSTVTSYLFSNTTVTVTRNLISGPGALVPCKAVAEAAVPQCVACLPSGYVVCAAAG